MSAGRPEGKEAPAPAPGGARRRWDIRGALHLAALALLYLVLVEQCMPALVAKHRAWALLPPLVPAVLGGWVFAAARGGDARLLGAVALILGASALVSALTLLLKS